MITAAQLRAARGLLDWTRTDLAKAAGVSPETIKNIEHGTFRPQESTADAIVRAFEIHDVSFLENEGVQKKRQMIKTFVGSEGYRNFLDDIYNTLINIGGDTCQFNFSDKIILSFAGDYAEYHLERMGKIEKLNARVLTPIGDRITPASYCTYRQLDESFGFGIPYYLYGNNTTMMTSKEGEDLVLISIYSEALTAAYREQFNVFWNKSSSS